MPKDVLPESSHAQLARPLTPQERAAELARGERAVSRDVRRAFVLVLLGCVLSLLLGLLLMGWAVYTTDPQLGQIAFFGGLLVGYSGIVVSLAQYYLRGERAGWW